MRLKIAGFIMGRLGRIPRVNDELTVQKENVRFKVKSMDQRRIEQLEMTRLKP